MFVRFVVGCLLVAVSATFTPAAKALEWYPRTADVEYMAIRTTSGPASLQLRLTASDYNAEELVVGALVHRTAGKAFDRVDDAVAYGQVNVPIGQAYSPVTGPVGCSKTSPLSQVCETSLDYGWTKVEYTHQDAGGPGAPNAFVILLHGTSDLSASFLPRNHGWVLRRVPTRVTSVMMRHSDALGVAGSEGPSSEVFLSASASGPAGGSVALGIPPCSDVLVGSAGLGQASLHGGTTAPTATCPVDHWVAAVARSRTTWTFSGAVAGLTTNPVAGDAAAARLVVFAAQ